MNLEDINVLDVFYKLNNEEINWINLIEKDELNGEIYNKYSKNILEFCVSNIVLILDSDNMHICDIIIMNILKHIKSINNIISQLERYIESFYLEDDTLKFIFNYISNLDIKETIKDHIIKLMFIYQEIPEDIMEKHANKYIKYICEYQSISDQFINNHKNKFDDFCWDLILKKSSVSENLIEKYQDKLNWDLICKHQKLSESFIEKYKDKINWDYISKYQTLYMPFIEKYQNKVNWDYIYKYQSMSLDFYYKYKGKLK